MCQSVLPQAADRWKLKRSGEGGREGGGSRSAAALDGGQSQLTLQLKIREAGREGAGVAPPSSLRPRPKPLPGVGQTQGCGQARGV